MDLTHEFSYNEMSMKQLLYATGFLDVKVRETDIYVVMFPLKIAARLVE